MIDRRTLLAVLLVAALVMAGCSSDPVQQPSPTSESPADSSADTTTSTSTTWTSTVRPSTTPSTRASTATDDTPRENDVVEWPKGPKERPDRPDTLTGATVREFVKTHEYRYVYNVDSGNKTGYSLACHVQAVDPAGEGYEVSVSCKGDYKENGGNYRIATPTTTYYVDDDSVVRNPTDG